MDCKQSAAPYRAQFDPANDPEDQFGETDCNFGRILEGGTRSRGDASSDESRSVIQGIALQRAVRAYIERSLNEKAMKASR